MSYTYIYTRTVEKEAFVQWLRKYISDTTVVNPLIKTSVLAPRYEISIPAHNRALSIAEWSKLDLPIERDFRLDFLVNGRPHWGVDFRPVNETETQVHVYYDDAFTVGCQKMEQHLEWEFPVAKQPTVQVKKVSERRKKNKSMRIKAGLIFWRHIQAAQSIDDVCNVTSIMQPSSYYNYHSDNLVYTDRDIRELGTTWTDLWGAYNRNRLEEFIRDLLERT